MANNTCLRPPINTREMPRSSALPKPDRKPAGIYNQAFWLAYIANVALVTANALTFRFAELVAYLGGSEKVAGTIVSVGVSGAIIARFFLGQALDRYGTRRLWAGSSLLFLAGCIAFLQCQELSPLIYAARISFAVGIAGMFTCSIVHIQNQVPPHRRTEMIGNLGSSGFLGMILGSQLGDLIFNSVPAGRPQFLILFGSATALGFFYLLVVLYVTRNDNHQRPHETPAAHRLILRYWPGMIIPVAIMMGMGIAVTTVFLTRFATEQNLNGIGTFFTVYATSAFLFRVSAQRWSQTVGRHRMVLMGLTGHAVGHCLLITVTAQWHFVPPAIACGFGHALLFPAVVSLGSGAFPSEYRGTGTTIILGFTELGVVLSAPILGGIIDFYRSNHADPIQGFTMMYFASAATATLVAIAYALTAARQPDEEVLPKAKTLNPVPLQPVGDNCPEMPTATDRTTAVFPHIGRNP